MMKKIWIKKNEYRDSLFLMKLSTDISNWPGIQQAVIVMGTDNNKQILEQVGLFDETASSASADDLIIAVEYSPERDVSDLFKMIEEDMTVKKKSSQEKEYKNLTDAISSEKDARVVVISAPGEYAGPLAKEALTSGKHVFCFSHHVSIEDEIELKKLAIQKNLLMMGPDCGTSILNGIGFGFANRIRAGKIGVVSASGSGLQEVTTLIHRAGGGISHAIGVGGRDMKSPVDGMMSAKAVEWVSRSKETGVLVILAKSASAQAVKNVLLAAKKTKLPVVVDFHTTEENRSNHEGVIFAQTFEECAQKALHLAGYPASFSAASAVAEEAWLAENQRRLRPEQWAVRGLFAGGSLCGEAAQILRSQGLAVENDPETYRKRQAAGHLLVDLGDEVFTEGRAHPFIDTRLRSLEIAKAFSDPSVAVVLMDVVLGWGSHSNPAGEIAQAVKKLSTNHKNRPAIVCTVCGTPDDFQGYAGQRRMLEEVGIFVTESNAAAARLAARFINSLRR